MISVFGFVSHTHSLLLDAEMALMYNDESVLKNHYLAVAFQLQHKDCDILENLKKKERQTVQRTIIDMVKIYDASEENSLHQCFSMPSTRKKCKSFPRIFVSLDCVTPSLKK